MGAAIATDAARIVHRRLRPALPLVTAQLTWMWKRREAQSLRVIDALVTRGEAAVDVGANWGLYAARLARLVGHGGQVDAFEPYPEHATTLEAMARRRPQLAVHLMALSDRDGTAELHVPVVQGRSVTALASFEPPGTGVAHEHLTVQVRRLDDMLTGRRSPSFIKCDVEGAELSVLEGADDTLRRSRPTLLVEIEQRHQRQPIDRTFRHLAALGYDGFFFGPRGISPVSEFDVERDQLQHLGAGVVEYGMPEGYVADFLFAGTGVDVERAIRRPTSGRRARHAPR
jgi:FkbM family methyltransferase